MRPHSHAQEGSPTKRAFSDRRVPIPVLLYHSISENPSAELLRWSVAPEVFDRQIKEIAARDFETVTFSRFVQYLHGNEVISGPPIVVTFDDGYADFLTEALPRLTEHEVAASLFVTTGKLAGGPRRRPVRLPDGATLSATELREVAAAGIEIGAHSVSHAQLDAVGRDRAQREIVDSKRILEEILGRKVQTFAYPHGHYDSRVRQIVIDSGFTSAAAVRNAFSTLDDDVFAIARLTVERGTSFETFLNWLDGKGAPIASPRQRLRTRVYRGYRKARCLREHARSRFSSDTGEVHET